jgi:hemin uptake protein HemP
MIFNIRYAPGSFCEVARVKEESKEGLPLKKEQSRRTRSIKSEELFPAGETEIWILHGSESYRLQVTKSGKLILTK